MYAKPIQTKIRQQFPHKYSITTKRTNICFRFRNAQTAHHLSTYHVSVYHQIDQPFLGVPRGILVDPETHAEVHTAYERLIADTLLLLRTEEGGTANRTTAEQAAVEIRRFEVHLAGVS